MTDRKPSERYRKPEQVTEAQYRQRLRCPKCGSREIYTRISTKEIVCRSCGTVTPLVEIVGDRVKDFKSYAETSRER
jgi:ribosomal protein S27E